jgi:sugar phosphate isomerase/epimerase
MHLTRRHLLAAAVAAPLVLPALAALPLPAIDPIRPPGVPRLIPGLAAYSLRQFFLGELQRRVAPEPKEKGIDLFGFIDYCASLGCAATELTGYFLPRDLGGDVLQRLRRHAFLRGVAISGTAIGNNFLLPEGDARDQEIAEARRWIDRAVLLGAPHIRIFAGRMPKDGDRAALRTPLVAALKDCAAYAGERGILLGLENHGAMTEDAATLIGLVEAVGSPWLGINLDSGNYVTADPYDDFARSVPYAVNVQVKVELNRKGSDALERTDVPRVAKILRDGGYQGFVTLEYEAKEDPWTAIPLAFAELRAACLA